MANARRPSLNSAGRNLLQRGKSWYWRGALPAEVVKRTGCRELVVTLKTRDLDRANRVAIAMSIVRDEISAGPLDFITPEILRDLVTKERDRYAAKLDRVHISDAWSAAPDPKAELQSDFMTGWAYRLIADFGPEISLNEANVDRLKGYLQRKGVLAGAHNQIIIHYAALRREWQHSDRDCRFKSELSTRNLVPNRTNWMQLRPEVCRMRAEALLAVEGRCEPPRVCRRAQLLSGKDHHEQDDEQVFT